MNKWCWCTGKSTLFFVFLLLKRFSSEILNLPFMIGTQWNMASCLRVSKNGSALQTILDYHEWSSSRPLSQSVNFEEFNLPLSRAPPARGRCEMILPWQMLPFGKGCNIFVLLLIHLQTWWKSLWGAYWIKKMQLHKNIYSAISLVKSL